MNLLEVMLESQVVSTAVLGSIAVIMFVILSREARVRPDAWWSSESALGIVFVPVLTILAAFSAGLGFVALGTSAAVPPTGQELSIAGGAVMLAALVWLISRALDSDTSAREDWQGARAQGAAVAAS